MTKLLNRSVEGAKWLLVIAVATFTTCCASPRPVVPNQTDEIGFRIRGVYVEFQREVGGDWNAGVQEIEFHDGTVLVECFKMEQWEYVYDRHLWSDSKAVRSMKVYLAVVDGVDWDHKGFAHLPQNKDGSLKTNVSAHFNFTYQQYHKTQGSVVKQSDEYMTWRIESDNPHRLVVEAGK